MIGRGRKGVGTTVMLLTDGNGIPLGVKLAPAKEAEVKHIDRLLDEAVVLLPARFRLMYDKAADSDGLRDTLAADGIELICAHRKNRKRPKRQDGRTLRRANKRRGESSGRTLGCITFDASQTATNAVRTYISASSSSPACSPSSRGFETASGVFEMACHSRRDQICLPIAHGCECRTNFREVG